MEAKLIPVRGYDAQEEIALSPDEPVVMGRGGSATVELPHGKVSRLHCRIAFENGFYRVEDLESKNGTWVNDRKIDKVILFNQDRITVGNAEFRFALDTGVAGDSSDLAADEEDVSFENEIRESAEVTAASSLLFGMEAVEHLRTAASQSASAFQQNPIG